MHRFRTPGLPPPAPAIGLPLGPCALGRVFPPSDSSDHSVTRGLSPRRPSRCSLIQHVAACGRRSTQALSALLARRGTRRGRSGRPACLGDESPGRCDAGARGPTMTTWHGTAGRLAVARSRGSRRATLSASAAVLGVLGLLWFPRPVGSREAVAPRISSASYPSTMGMLQALLRRTGRWRQSAPGPCSARAWPRRSGRRVHPPFPQTCVFVSFKHWHAVRSMLLRYVPPPDAPLWALPAPPRCYTGGELR
jgi:hypothetical protein